MVISAEVARRRLEMAVISSGLSISEAITILDKAGFGALIIAEDERKIVGILTDGDIRRAIIQNISFTSQCIVIANTSPVVADHNIAREEALHIMDHARSFKLNHLPLVDKAGRVVNLLLRGDLISEEPCAMSAVIMAGGLGTRLRPLTEDLPKPMLPVGGKPLMERVIGQLRQAGIRRINVTTLYKPEKITEHFGDGKGFGVELCYLNEDRPLGTAGALGLMTTPTDPVLVINGDIITQVDFKGMLSYHREHSADMTVGVRRYGVQVPYGVVECEGPRIVSLSEKPQISFLVNAGIYLLEPSVYRFIPNGEHFNMTDLIHRLLDAECRVVSFPIIEYWLDIGQHADYEQAQNDVREGKITHEFGK
jgi:dTDP-glucose pyrophosphorylase/CBS domain-containing protein